MDVCYFEETIFVCSYLAVGRMCNKHADQRKRSQVCKQARYIKDTNFALHVYTTWTHVQKSDSFQ